MLICTCRWWLYRARCLCVCQLHSLLQRSPGPNWRLYFRKRESFPTRCSSISREHRAGLTASDKVWESLTYLRDTWSTSSACLTLKSSGKKLVCFSKLVYTCYAVLNLMYVCIYTFHTFGVWIAQLCDLLLSLFVFKTVTAFSSSWWLTVSGRQLV